jgi:hypothetical protein
VGTTTSTTTTTTAKFTHFTDEFKDEQLHGWQAKALWKV